MRRRALNATWFAPILLGLLWASGPSYARQWESSLASAGSLRTVIRAMSPSPIFSASLDASFDRSFFSQAKTTRQILDLADSNTRCDLITISGRDWAACRSNDTPNVTTNYLIRGDTIYEVSFSQGTRAGVRARIDRIFASLEALPREN